MNEGRGTGDRQAIEMDMLRAIRAFSDAQDRMYGGMKHGMDMNVTDIAALRFVNIRAEEGRMVTPNEISKHLRISTASITKLLDRMTESGHMLRTPHPTDGRSRVVELTDKAKFEFFRLFGPQLALMRQAFTEFSADELDAAMRVLRAVNVVIDPAIEAVAKAS